MKTLPSLEVMDSVFVVFQIVVLSAEACVAYQAMSGLSIRINLGPSDYPMLPRLTHQQVMKDMHSLPLNTPQNTLKASLLKFLMIDC